MPRARLYGEDEQELAQDLDPFTTQQSYHKWDARLTVSALDGNWDVVVVGRNLSNKTTMGFSNDVSLFPGSYFGITESPRSIAVQASLRF